MKPHTRTAQTVEMFRPRLDEQLNMKHPLIRLTGLMDWELIEQHFAGHFTSGRGRPALPARLVAGLLYLQHANAASDEMVVNTWLENPYWQFFTGEDYLQTELPIDPSSLTRWRQRIGEEGVVRRRAQPAPDPGCAAALLRPLRAVAARSHCRPDRTSTLQTIRNRVKTGLVRADSLSLSSY